MENGQATYHGATLPAHPGGCREQIQNLLCELRQDPRFDEWCHLTNALGLGSLTLRALAELHDGATEALFPESAAREVARGSDLAVVPDTMLFAADGAVDGIVAGAATTHAPARSAPPLAVSRELARPVQGMNGGFTTRAAAS